MTEAIIMRRLARPVAADRIILPGRCRADLAHLSEHFGVPVARGPDELSDLPALSRPRRASKRISPVFRFAFSPRSSMRPRSRLRPCSPAPRPCEDRRRCDRHWLSSRYAVPASRGERARLESGGASGQRRFRRSPRARARRSRRERIFLLSLDEATLDIAEGTGATPILVPSPHGDLESLVRAAQDAERRGLSFIVDPILDPIHFGLAASLTRYIETRRRLPEARNDDGNRQSHRIDGGGFRAASPPF